MHRHFDEPHPFAFDTATPHYAADRPVRPEHVKLDVRLDFQKKALAGTCSTRLRAVRAVKEMRFDAVDLEVSKVTVDGKAATFRNDGRVLTVALGRATRPAQVLTVDIAYGCTPRRGLYFVGPDATDPTRPMQAWTQGQDEDSRHWFPCLDAPAQKASTEVRATFPDGMRALSNGALLSDTVKGGKRTTHYRLDAPHSPYLVTLVVGDFDEHTAKAGSTTVRSLYPRGKKDEALRCVERTPQMVAHYESLTGQPYPWGDYAQVFTAEFIFGGMENTGATTLTDVVLHDERAALDYNVEPLISHELAHQWFGDLLTCRDWPHGWLNEGFATYFEVLWKEHADSRDEGDHQRGLDLSEYLSEASERYARPLVTRNFDAPIDVFDRHLYEKGALVLHALRTRLGDDDFFASLKAYVATHKTGAVETVDLARAVELTTGKNLDSFFDQWAHREGHPDLHVEVSHDSEAKKARLSVKQAQKGEAFHFPLAVELVVGGKSTHHRFEVTDKEHVFLLPAASEPTQVLVDPRRDILGTLEVKKSPAQWREELLHGEVARARSEAAAALGKDASVQNAAACKKVLLDEKVFWGTRAACAKALGAMLSPASKAALLAATGIKHPKARRAVVQALAAFIEDKEVGERLKTWAEKGDPSVFVEAEAARALGKVRGAAARKTLEKLLARTSFQDTVGVGALDGLAALQDGAAWDAVVERTKVGQPMFGRRAAYLAAARLAEVAGKKTEAVHLVTQALRDSQFRVQMGAFEAAAALNDSRILSALSSTPFLDGRAIRASKETARTIREGAGQKKELTALRGELEKLKADVRALQQQKAKH
jgi:aminopeptidase N